MYNESRMCENDKQQDTGGERLEKRKCEGIINKARFGQNTDCTSNWIRRVNRKRRDGVQSFIFIVPGIVNKI